MTRRLANPAKHHVLASLTPAQQRQRLREFDGGWVGAAGLGIFMLTGAISLFVLSLVSEWAIHIIGRSSTKLTLVTVAGTGLALALAALSWTVFRRWILNGAFDRAWLERCARCSYDRRGLAADAKCPECGTIPAPGPK